MSPQKTRLLRSALDVLYYTNTHRFLSRRWSGAGVIFTLHHVCPQDERAFAPNRILEITPEFLDRTLRHVRASGIEIVSLDEARRRIIKRSLDRRFACFTLDDGYADNCAFALPWLIEREIPFTYFVASDAILEGTPFPHDVARNELLQWCTGLIHVSMSKLFVTCTRNTEKRSLKDSTACLPLLFGSSLNGN